MCVVELWGIEFCLLVFVEWWCDAQLRAVRGLPWSKRMWHPFLLVFIAHFLCLHPFKGESSSPSLPSSHPLSRTSTAFLCPPKLNSTLMIRCFLPLPRPGAAAASRARRTGWGVGMAHGAGGDLAVLLHTAASANYFAWPQRLHCSLSSGKCLFAGKKAGAVAEMYLDLCKHQQSQFPSFRNPCYKNFFIWDSMYEVQRGGVAQISLKLRSTHSRQLSSYLCLQYAINITFFRKYSMENIPWVN